MRKVKASIAKAIVIEVENEYHVDRFDRWKKVYRTAEPAAGCWVEIKIAAWEEKKFSAPVSGAAYHNMTMADYDERDRRREKLYRRVLPIFKAMLA